MLRVLIFHLERNSVNENFGFNIYLTKDSSKNTGAPEINEIKTGSRAENAGLRVGDRVIAVDDQNVTTAKEVYEIFREKLKAKVMIERMGVTNVQKKVSVQQKVNLFSSCYGYFTYSYEHADLYNMRFDETLI